MVIDRVRRFRHAANVRLLSDTSRSAVFARTKVWERQLRLLRQTWWLIVGTVAAAALLAWPAATRFEGAARGAVIGATTVGTLAVMLGAVFVLSGAASAMGGAIAESSTASELNRLRRRRWKVVHGLKLREQSDIDHVLIGPGGVIVVETKWSADPWPTSRTEGGYMAPRLQKGIAQVDRAISHVKSTLGSHAKARGVTRGLLVLDSAYIDVAWPPYSGSAFTVLRAGDLRAFLDDLPTDVLTDEAINEMIDLLATREFARAQRDAETGTLIPPTLEQLARRWVVVAPLTFLAAGMGSAELAGQLQLPGWAIGTAIALLGMRLWHRPALKPIALGVVLGHLLVSGVLVSALAGA